MRKRDHLVLGALCALSTAALLAGCVPPTDPPDPGIEPGTLHDLLNPGYAGDVSADGRYVVTADNEAVELHDRALGTVDRLSRDNYPNGAAVSDDGRYVAFRHVSDGFNGPSASVWDSVTDQVTPIPSLGADATGSRPSPSISANGRYVAYVQGDACELGGCIGFWDIYSNLFMFDRVTGQTVQLTTFGVLEGYIGSGTVDDFHVVGDGSAILYARTSRATTDDPGATELVRWDRATGTETVLPTAPGGVSSITASHDGSRIAYQHATAPTSEDVVFSVQFISDDPLDLSGAPLNPDEQHGYPELSADGSMLFFAAGERVQWLEPTLEPRALIAVELDGTFSERREITDEPNGSDVRPRKAILLDGDHAIAYSSHDEDIAYALRAWQPR